MPLTAFYAIDQTELPRQHWELADCFADLHALTTGGVPGVARITVADLMLVLEVLSQAESRQELERHRNAVARVREAVGEAGRVAH